MENLLKAVGITTEEVESWQDEDVSHSGLNEASTERSRPLSPPLPDVPHLTLCVSLKAPQSIALDERGEPEIPEAAITPVPRETETATDVGGEPEIPEATWQFLEARWNAILGMEAGVDNLRMSMDGLRSEMEAAARKALPLEVKVNALSADVVQWNKAKSRIHYAVPKVREFIHRATWATGTPERKKLTELFETHIQPRIPFPRIDDMMVQFEGLLKDRQNLYAQGMTVYQECKGICAECQGYSADTGEQCRFQCQSEKGRHRFEG